jgi:hypothetical protein
MPPGREPADDRHADRFALVVTAVFGAAALFALTQHEMWRDEVQAWLIARDSATPLDVLRNLKYDGHPALWHLSLWLLKLIAPVPAVMRALHWVIAVSAVYLVARYAPFTRVQRALFAAGYFPLFEYAAVSRNYALGAALVFAACALFVRARPLAFALVVGLMAHANLFAFILGIACAAAGVAARLWSRHRAEERRTGRRAWLLPGLIVLTLFASSALQLLPPDDIGHALGWHFRPDRERLLEVALALPTALFPFRQLTEHWWAATPVGALPGWRVVLAPLALAIALLAVLALAQRRSALVFLLVAGTGLFAFFYLKFTAGPNHTGHLYLALIAALWIGHGDLELPQGAASQRLWQLMSGPVLTLLLAAHAAAGVIAVWLERRYTFSMGRATADYLRQQHLDAYPMVADPDFAATTVLGYLGKESAWFPRGERQGSFVIWDMKRVPAATDSAVAAAADSISRAGHDTVVVLLDRELDPTSAGADLTRVASFTGGVISNEDSYIYLLISDGSRIGR